ncbi:MAG: hypothetical protein ABSF83_08020 [Nitrososphaerales archaeon]|jgi:hypothetical protein
MALGEMNGMEFAGTMQTLKGEIGDVSSTIRTALTEVLGDLAGPSTLSYTGDVPDGNFLAFAKRVYELFGTGAAAVLSEIASWVTTHVKKL